MRKTIKASSDAAFQKLLPVLHDEAVVVVENRERLYVTAEKVTNALVDRLEAMGATVDEDYQYQQDALSL